MWREIEAMRTKKNQAVSLKAVGTKAPQRGTKAPRSSRVNFDTVTDLGNHWFKASVQGFDLLRIPSYKTSCIDFTSDELEGYVKYLDGVRKDLIGKSWLIGKQAVRSGSADLSRLVENYMGKSELWLEYFLGLLAHLPQVNGRQRHRVTVTCNDVKRHEPVLRKLATGTHTVLLAGQRATVEIEIKEVLPEGYAALKNYNLTGAVRVVDFGGGNITISGFEGDLLVGEPLVKDFGCETVLQDLAGSSQLKTIIQQAPNLDTLNLSLEKGVKKIKGTNDYAMYYGASSLNILPAYKEVLSLFIDCKLREIIKMLDGYLIYGETILVIGGGSKLPLLGAALKKKGYKISSDGGFDNIKGLIKE